jgi:ribonuclease HII
MIFKMTISGFETRASEKQPHSSEKWVVGVDEAGRGPLAGPVAVGLVKAREDFDISKAFPGLNDSKKLSEKNRERLFTLLEEHVAQGNVAYVVVMRSALDIDRKGIAVCISEAVAEGLEELLGMGRASSKKDVKVWLDGALRAPSQYPQETVIRGDSIIPSIMLASVAAKVTRDHFMRAQSTLYPQYNFETHKGYGTKAHMDTIRTHGQCPLHRKTFIHF